jgi:hypothetical protein
MNKDVLAVALRLDEAVTLGRIEPFDGTRRHLSLLQSSIAVADTERKARPKVTTLRQAQHPPMPLALFLGPRRYSAALVALRKQRTS